MVLAGNKAKRLSLVNHTTKTVQFSIELIGLPEKTNGEDLEHLLVDAFKTAGVKVKKRDFQAIHCLADKKIVIAKLFNRIDAPNLLRNKKNHENSIITTKINSNQGKHM